MEDCVAALKKTVVRRDNIIRRLYSLVTPGEPLPDCIFAYGHIATGKSLIIEGVLNHLKYKVSIINCIEHPTIKYMFECILMDLTSTPLTSEDDFKSPIKCDYLMDFIAQLRKISVEDDSPMFIVFNKCEKLRDKPDLLLGFLKLKELSGVNVCPIFITDIVWERFYSNIKVKLPIKLHFPQYLQTEMAEILLFYKPQGYRDDFYKNYLNIFLRMFFRVCRDLNELRYMASINFEKYVEPIEAGTCTANDAKLLWSYAVSVFKANLEVIYMRVSVDDFLKNIALSEEIESITKLALSFELPAYAKYILIASYLASYNPVKEDKYLFMKGATKRKKRAAVSRKKEVLNTHMGPRIFPLQRMLMIFSCIVEEEVDINTKLLAQIPTMCQLGLLANVGENNIDEPKYKCCVSYDFALVISKTVGFELKHYLFDFIH